MAHKMKAAQAESDSLIKQLNEYDCVKEKLADEVKENQKNRNESSRLLKRCKILEFELSTARSAIDD